MKPQSSLERLNFMEKHKKRWIKPLHWAKCVGFVVSVCLLRPHSLLAQEDLPSRAIYIVYDDSGSMYVDNDGNMVDTWSKAKYSMEVFASMLGHDDSMAIYYMSDYSKDGQKDGPKIELDGSDSTQINVQKIHSQRTASGYTPFETVEAAYADLEKNEADEKWLVILTDGDFQKNDEALEDKTKVTQFMDDFFENKDSEVNVAFLAIGENVIPLTENQEENIFFEKAKDSSQILEKVTEISNRIFNMNRLNLNASEGQFEIDIPMSQFTVFVQGPNAKIEGLTNAQGQEVGTLEEVVGVKATETSDNDFHQDNPPDTALSGELATFTGSFPPGTYQVKAQNAQKIEIYYKPNLDVIAYLTTPSGEKITNLADLPTGDYSIHFELVSGLDQSALPQRNLINQSEGGIQYQARIKNNGKTLDSLFKDGDSIHVEQGNLDIDVTATYLKYNTSTTHLNYNIWAEKMVSFETIDQGPWTLNKTLEPTNPFKVKLLVEGQTPTYEEWEQIGLPSIQVLKSSCDTPTVIKEDTPGLYSIVPNEQQTNFEWETYNQADFILKFDQEIDQIPWQGSQEVSVKIDDKRNWFIRHGKWFQENWWVVGLGLILLIGLIGYLPPFKKWLPKMPNTPKITCQPKDGSDETVSPGQIKKDFLSTWIPWRAQKAKIQFIPRGRIGVYAPDLEVKATKNGKMELTNLEAFKNTTVQRDSEFLTEVIEEYQSTSTQSKKQKPFLIKRTSVIETEGEDEKFICSLKDKFKS